MFDFLFRKRRAMREELARKETIRKAEDAAKKLKANQEQAERMRPYNAVIFNDRPHKDLPGIRGYARPRPAQNASLAADASQQNILLDPSYMWMPGNVYHSMVSSPSPAPSPSYECPAPSPSYEAPAPSPSYDSSSSSDSGSSSSCGSSDW